MLWWSKAAGMGRRVSLGASLSGALSVWASMTAWAPRRSFSQTHFQSNQTVKTRMKVIGQIGPFHTLLRKIARRDSVTRLTTG